MQCSCEAPPCEHADWIVQHQDDLCLPLGGSLRVLESLGCFRCSCSRGTSVSSSSSNSGPVLCREFFRSLGEGTWVRDLIDPQASVDTNPPDWHPCEPSQTFKARGPEHRTALSVKHRRTAPHHSVSPKLGTSLLLSTGFAATQAHCDSDSRSFLCGCMMYMPHRNLT